MEYIKSEKQDDRFKTSIFFLEVGLSLLFIFMITIGFLRFFYQDNLFIIHITNYLIYYWYFHPFLFLLTYSVFSLFIIVLFKRTLFFNIHKKGIFVFAHLSFIVFVVLGGAIAPWYWEYYVGKYHEEIETAQKFIFFSGDWCDVNSHDYCMSVVVSNIDGTEKEIKASFTEDENDSFGYVSPNGNYLLNNLEVINIFGEVIYEIDREFSFLSWSPNSQYIAVFDYGQKSLSDDNWFKNLVLYDIENKKKYILDTRISSENYPKKSSFSWSDDSTKIYLSDVRTSEIYEISDITSNNANKKTLSNLTFCNSINYFSGKIYCYIKAAESDVDICEGRCEKNKDYFIISQGLNQQYKNSFVVINDTPFVRLDYMVVVDDTYLVAYPDFGGNIILNIKNGSSGEVGERDNIFYSVDLDVSATPIRYNNIRN